MNEFLFNLWIILGCKAAVMFILQGTNNAAPRTIVRRELYRTHSMYWDLYIMM